MNELEIKPKAQLGRGVFHQAFPFHKFDDKVIKTRMGDLKLFQGQPELINKHKMDLEEMKIFQQYPQFFAKVYKLTERYAVIEKLDTKEYKLEARKIADGIFKLACMPKVAAVILPYHIDPDLSDPDDIQVSSIIYTLLIRPDVDYRAKTLEAYCSGTRFKELYEFISDVNKTFKDKVIDFHDGNLGINKQGKFRLLDI